MRIFFSDIQKCDVWIIYCCNKLLWLWIYIYYFFSMRVRRKTVTNMIFIFNNFCVIISCTVNIFVSKNGYSRREMLQNLLCLFKKKPPSNFFRFSLQATLSFCFMNARLNGLAGINLWNQKSSVFILFSSSLFHHQDFTSHFEIKLLPISFTEKIILK